jgi:hypothetical protein
MSYTDSTPSTLCSQRTPASEPARERLRVVVNSLCCCGGRGPTDPSACPACMVWHCMEVLRTVPAVRDQVRA